jgi:hypothetical protein
MKEACTLEAGVPRRFPEEECMKSQLLLLVLLGLSLVTTGSGAANATDISGAWGITIERTAEQGGTVNDTLVFKQEGEKLSGAYSGYFGKHKFSGTVKANKVEFTWEKPPTDGPKQPITVTFIGTLESPTKMTGTVVAFCREEKCKWTATRKK